MCVMLTLLKTVGDEVIMIRQALKLGMRGIIDTVFAKSVIANELLVKQLPAELEDWIDQLHFAAAKVRVGQIDAKAWQLEMDKFYTSVDINVLMAHIDMDKLKNQIDYGVRGECFLSTPLRLNPKNPIESDIPLNVIEKFGSVKKGCHIPPHGHANICSAFLIVSGRIRARQFDRVGWDNGKKTLVINKTVDEIQTRGQWTSISDYHNNCHWLTAESDDCYFFSTKLVDIQPETRTYHRLSFHYEAGNDLGSDLREVPLISGQRAAEIYNLRKK